MPRFCIVAGVGDVSLRAEVVTSRRYGASAYWGLGFAGPGYMLKYPSLNAPFP